MNASRKYQLRIFSYEDIRVMQKNSPPTLQLPQPNRTKDRVVFILEEEAWGEFAVFRLHTVFPIRIRTSERLRWSPMKKGFQHLQFDEFADTTTTTTTTTVMVMVMVMVTKTTMAKT
ncbi:hypothetical protein M0802_007604 [Mischocyttarus mexicanus]|nr:hypothetical protein M0802_007604 [Mischocyttarus mexicanus]